MTATIQHLSFPVAEFKALGDPKNGEWSALVAVFGNVDRVGDRVKKGAYSDTLTEWRSKGDPIPMIWNHEWSNPFAHIGYSAPEDVVENDAGLLVKRAKTDMDKPFAAQVFDLMVTRRVKEFSFGYNAREEAMVKGEDGRWINELLNLELFEIGPTLKGVNPDTRLIAAKSMLAAEFAAAQVTGELSEGSRKRLEDAYTVLGALLEAGGTAGTGEHETKSGEAEAQGKASDPDEDIRTLIALTRSQLA